ncbi:FHA domain-containing protein [Saccharothrix obliqua]|uniref:FHA domain-containing protein n=1 Tax=Saccharothrix obliqua TaxID=2861747 RepID=UPI001C5CF2AE|nr:FHA domain-containing protein [Saccharothrix obliqua]MBW4720617.1 FHA domain-containing protein [Saccharothrix obliqua]
MTGYVPGGAVAVVADRTWLLLGVAPGSDVVRRCWELVRGGAGLDDVLSVIVHEGFRAVGSFALARHVAEERRVVLRGAAVVGLVGADGVPLELRADGVATWVDTGLPDDVVELWLAAGEARGAELPLERGVVVAGRVVARLAVVGGGVPDQDQPDADETGWSERVDETVVRHSGSPDDTRHVFAAGAPKVRAVACPARHLNPEHAIACRVCGQALPPQEAFVVPRPPLGVLRLSTGELITLDRNVVLGRDPRVTDRGADAPHGIRLANQGNDISRNHVEVRLDGWDVLVVDLGSKNGTTVIAPGWSPQELAKLIPAILTPGSRVVLGDGAFFTYEVTG